MSIFVAHEIVADAHRPSVFRETELEIYFDTRAFFGDQELALEFIQDDELIEVTPTAIRLRKRVLDPNQRKKAAKKAMQRA